MPSSAAKLTQPMRLSAVIDPSLLLTPSSLFSLGLATAFTPCSLGMIPLTVTYLTNEDVVVSGKEEATPDVIPSFLFALGLTLAYICSGTVLLLALSVPSQQLQIQGLGKGISAAVTAAAGASIAGAIEIPIFNGPVFEGRGGNEDEYSVFGSTYLRPVLLGATTALSSTPCATPIVAALLSQISANSGGILSASPLLLSYGLGVSAPIVIFSKLGSSAAIEVVKRTGESSVRLQKLMGLGLMTLAFYQVLVLFWGDPGLFFV